MQLIINDYEEADALRAAAEFVTKLADITENRPVRPLTEIPTVAANVAEVTGADTTGGEQAPPPADVELDSAGIPWDERIHSSGKSKNNDGTWKRKRGVEQAEYERILAELTLSSQVPLDDEKGTAENAEGETQEETPPAAAATATANDVFGIGEAQAGIAQEETPPTTMQWPDFLNILTTAQAEGRLDANKVSEWLTANKVDKVPLLSNRPDLWDSFLTFNGLK